jgi:dienelactone hydrolase
LRTDPELAEDARKIGAWLVERGLVDRARLGIGGHSMGGKASIMAALEDPRFHAVVAIDPDENGYTHVARGPIARLRAPLLVVGAEDAIKGWKICATPDGNYRRFFDHAPPGTIEVTLQRADHVQFMDAPDGLGMGICRVGAADSRLVRNVTRGALAQFLDEHLNQSGTCAFAPTPGVLVRIKGAGASSARR